MPVTKGAVMPLVALFSNAAFDSEATQLLGAAFEAAWQKVKSTSSALAEGSEAALTRELLAKRIIELAKRGERNPDRLVESALDHLARSRATSHSAITLG
jgi:uncharacterized protein with NRDE domain